jgi:hypothetical protein
MKSRDAMLAAGFRSRARYGLEIIATNIVHQSSSAKVGIHPGIHHQ